MRKDIDPIKAGKEKTSFPEILLLKIAKIINDKSTVEEVHAALLKSEDPNEKTLSFAVRSVLWHYKPNTKLDRELRYRIASDLNQFIQLYTTGKEPRDTILKRYNTWRSTTD